MRNLTDLINESKIDIKEVQEKSSKYGEDLAKQFIKDCRELEKMDDISFMPREIMKCFLTYLFENMLDYETVGIGDAIHQINKEYQIS